MDDVELKLLKLILSKRYWLLLIDYKLKCNWCRPMGIQLR